ncbi:hypothetical protein [Arthrobacter sulfonylureivorans]|uniref:Secreted protein n=1 Tax=Arthrobacter sulfonylureivorans TaxID=2486855 RepID=A0ABY3W4G9_9MICC|nr:hypothetical protein [Arthrobacter sulfonylureivorans]UNK45104.1 hypothetical protein MNQ99_14315 [Arthrobacter sulfonylureivorans]
MSAPAAEDAALRIGRFSLAVWLVGLLILGGTLAFAAPRLLPHLFSADWNQDSAAHSAAEPAAEAGPGSAPVSGGEGASGDNGDGGAAGGGGAAGSAGSPGAASEGETPVKSDGAGSYSGSRDATIDYQRRADYDGPFEVVVTSGVDVSVAVDDPDNPKWPVHFLYNSADRNEPATALLAPARDEFTLTIDAEGDWQLEVRPVPYAELEGGTVSGYGPALVRYEGEEVLAEFTYKGESNIAVYTWQESRRNLVVNKIGSSSTRFSWQPYPVTYFLVDTTDGQWSFRVGR